MQYTFIADYYSQKNFVLLQKSAMAHSENSHFNTQFTCIWTIENMCVPCNVDSPVFTVKYMEMTKWCLTIDADNLGFIGLSIQRFDDDGPKFIGIVFTLSILGTDGLPLNIYANEKQFKIYDSSEIEHFANQYEVFFGSRAVFLPNDEFTIRCQMWRTGTRRRLNDSCFLRSRLRPGRHSFVWDIRNFFTIPRDHERKILLNDCPTDEVTFNLHETENDGEKYISISTKARDYNWTCLKISLLDFEGTVVHAVRKSGICHDDYQIENFFAKRKLMEDTMSLAQNDVMELRVEIISYARIVSSEIENYRCLNMKSCPVCPSDERVIKSEEGEVLHLVHDETSNETSPLTKAMKNIIQMGTESDVSIRAGSKSFPAHKFLLSARSPVFKDMFRGDMKEEVGKCIEIPEVDEVTLAELLSYIYTDKIEELEWRRAVNLYKVAGRYQFLDLKRKCATFLKSDLSVNNVCAILSVAFTNHDTELLEAAEDFIMQQGTEFFRTDTWQRFQMENHGLFFKRWGRCLARFRSKNEGVHGREMS